MAFNRCHDQDDPFTRRVRETYRANVISAPRAGIEPLDTLAVRNRKVGEPRGDLVAMLSGASPTLPEPTASPVAALSGVRSAAVDLQLGLALSARFLAALGVPVPGASITASPWQGASGFTFEVKDVTEHEVDIARLGRALDGQKLAQTAATAVFFSRDGTDLYLITRTLTSRSFAIKATTEHGQSVKVAVDGLADVIGEASAGVSWRADRDDTISFSGSAPVTFAFSAVPCAIDAAGNLVFGLTADKLTFGAGRPEVPEVAPLIDEAGLVGFDELGAPA